jgi:hypothetical protein
MYYSKWCAKEKQPDKRCGTCGAWELQGVIWGKCDTIDSEFHRMLRCEDEPPCSTWRPKEEKVEEWPKVGDKVAWYNEKANYGEGIVEQGPRASDGCVLVNWKKRATYWQSPGNLVRPSKAEEWHGFKRGEKVRVEVRSIKDVWNGIVEANGPHPKTLWIRRDDGRGVNVHTDYITRPPVEREFNVGDRARIGNGKIGKLSGPLSTKIGRINRYMCALITWSQHSA